MYSNFEWPVPHYFEPILSPDGTGHEPATLQLRAEKRVEPEAKDEPVSETDNTLVRLANE